MRRDVAKVITERERRHSSDKKERKGYKKRLQQEGLDCVKRESIKARGNNDKDFTDVLAPLTGFLRKNVGRPWGKICSEVSAVLPAGGGVSLAHARGHLFEMVETATQEVNGEILDSKGFPLNYYRYWCRHQFYVDPNGFLRACKEVSYKWKKEEGPWFQKNNRGEWLVFDKWDTKCWFACEMVPYEPIGTEPTAEVLHKMTFYRTRRIFPLAYDVMLKRSLHGDADVRELLRNYGAYVYCAKRRQIGSRQIKKYKLNG